MTAAARGSVFHKTTIADVCRASADPYRAAVVKMVYRNAETYRVVFHFEDDSTLTFRKEYHLETSI